MKYSVAVLLLLGLISSAEAVNLNQRAMVDLELLGQPAQNQTVKAV